MTRTARQRPVTFALDLLFPQPCAGCGGELPVGEGDLPLCGGCRQVLRDELRDASGYCFRCGGSVVPEQETPCLRCRDRELAFASHESLFDYGGLLRELLHEYKFSGRTGLGRLFAELLAVRIGSAYRASVLVPVPARAQRIRNHGYDTVDLVVRRLATAHHLPVARLLRRRGGRQQKGLGRAARSRNMSGRFRLQQQPPRRPLLLIDDVHTTGATAHECASVLVSAGATVVQVLTLAQD